MKIPKDKEKRQRGGRESKRKNAQRAKISTTKSCDITKRLNEIYSKESSEIDPVLYLLQIESLKRVPW